MCAQLSEKEKDYIYFNYPKTFNLKCIIKFIELFERKRLSLLYIIIHKYINIYINELSFFIKGLLRYIEAVENLTCSNLSNGFVKATNSKLKMIKKRYMKDVFKDLLQQS